MAERRFVLPRVGLNTSLDLGGALRARQKPGHDLPAERPSPEALPAGAPETMPVAVPEPAEPPFSVPEPAEPPFSVPEPAEPPFSMPEPAEPPFYGTGRPVQTSIAVEKDCAVVLDQFARAADVSVNALAVAALHSGLPSEIDEAREMVRDERIQRAGSRARRLERNLRLPEDLRNRIDELMSATRARIPRATRADLINAAVRRGLPADGKRAAALVVEHAQRAERAAAD